ncbi:hypothetical protein F4703DRAFT_1882110 [Phycomyces blakesleeanus]|uniref:Secreted protein n=1 Tax=Phycomyces blakesleeanus (strain ATCC 8743b / DSM 1359 / FGSC 10004 / NBRC 33097 / NRRL 1555) TaxID=763407 RepID=A0A167P1U6_PHYB8|nr:hypothetical protein PHYBLDRAFT_180313 [Phycomyces blakesleeanus NRRL 1555(-)]OAD77086.1 hypothetical protein PHYBLDRAFT_180313 [Phycomyces blakesleeanus NRRL 1555(-)]|eukprot:XP_018295126.1 hypothetical protein PHYBLDRAFT_180313 [Phycomyces blakesleeanus NRRL 1555(-)]
MPKGTIISPKFWVLPVLLVSGAALISRSKTSPVQPNNYVLSGEKLGDQETLERVRKDWRKRNNGIGLRDVDRSGGGV